MEIEEAKKLLSSVFEKIMNTQSIGELKEFEENLDNKLDLDKYPELNFGISIDEIKKLKANGLINEKNQLSKDISKKLDSTISKLLYALAWKNGDLLKLNHIIEGIENSENNINRDKGIVFYQFGKFLSSRNEPIVDQHIMRAFLAYKAENDPEKFEIAINLKSLKKYDHINEYKSWLNEIPRNLRNEEGFYWIDKILFAVGKTIKNTF